MIDRPTPETDAFAIKFKTTCGEKYWVPVDIARKLERERDETRDAIRVLAEHGESEIQRITKERDEARESLKHITEYGTEEINAAVELRQKLAQALVDLDNMQDQRDIAMKVIKRLEKERDEARVALASREVVIAQQNVITDLMLERDEAREELMRIEEVFIDSDDTYEDLIKIGNIARAALGSKNYDLVT